MVPKRKVEDELDDGARRTRGVRTGGRSARVVDAVLEATLEELGEAGYGGLRIERIAERAGVHKTTVYRRWPTTAELVIAALRRSGQPSIDVDTGSVREDVLAMTRGKVDWFQTPRGRGVARAIHAERHHPEVAAIIERLRAEQLARRVEALRRGVARGELPEGTDVELVADVIHAAIVSRVVAREQTLDEETLAAVVDLVLAGAAAGAGPLPGPETTPER